MRPGFGQFNVDIIHYNPVCLNSLLYAMELDTAQILGILGRQPDAAVWRKRAVDRAERINRLMWDPQDGLYYDYEFVHRRVRRYPFLTTFFPLWTGLASKEQAAAVEKNLHKFEREGGLQTSTFASTFAGLRTVDDPEEPPEPWRFREVCGLHVSRATPGVLAISSQAIRRAAVGGASPFFIADDPSLWQ